MAVRRGGHLVTKALLLAAPTRHMARMYAVVAKQVRRADADLPGALSDLLVVPPGSRVSDAGEAAAGA